MSSKMSIDWRKSRRSMANGACVEVTMLDRRTVSTSA